MVTITHPQVEPLSESVARLAEESSIALRRLIGEEAVLGNPALTMSIESPGGARADIAVPGATLPLLQSVLSELGQGKGVAVIAMDTEITTQQAAEILNVSRPYFVKLLTAGKMPYRAVGSRRRVLLADLLRYKESETIGRHAGLDELVAESQKLGMY